jgi:hypothetical protein
VGRKKDSMSQLHIEITIQDNLSGTCLTWFEGLQIQQIENNSTCLSGEIADYPALYGLLERIRDLNLHLLMVQVKIIFQKGSIK